MSETPSDPTISAPWWKKKWVITVIVIGLLGLGGAIIGDDDLREDTPTAAVTEESSSVEADEAPSEDETDAEAESAQESDPCPTDGATREVSAACIDPWPLTVESGTLRCDASSVTIAADGNVWAVNGMADTRGDGEDIDPIWAEGDATPKVSIGALIDAGLELCD